MSSPNAAHAIPEPVDPAAERAATTGLGELLGGVTRDLSTLFRQEVELAKAELTESAKKAGKGVGMFAGAGVAGYFALLFLSLTIAIALGYLIGFGWSFLIVTVIYAIVALVLFLRGRTQLKSIQGAPQTVDTVKQIPEALKPGGNASNPDQIRAEIEETRRNLGSDVDALADKVSPHQIAERQKEKVRGRVTSVKESIMGAAHTAQDKVQSAQDSVSGAAHDAGGTAADAKATAAGHPMIVGLIAFGAGWLLSSLLPSSQAEQDLAGSAKAKAAPLADKVKEVAKDAGQEIAQNLKEPAQQAAQSVKESATDAAQTVKSEGQSAAQDVKGQAQDAKDSVTDKALDAKDQIQGQAAGAKDDLQGQAQDAKQRVQS